MSVFKLGDFAGQSNSSFDLLPGEYDGKIKDIEAGEWPSGDEFLRFRFETEDGRKASWTYNTDPSKSNGVGLKILADDLVAAGFKSDAQLDTDPATLAKQLSPMVNRKFKVRVFVSQGKTSDKIFTNYRIKGPIVGSVSGASAYESV